MSSSYKKRIMIRGDCLSQRAENNELDACKLVWEYVCGGAPHTGIQLRNELLSIALTVNDRIVPKGKLFREWVPPEGHRCPAPSIPDEIARLTEELYTKWFTEASSILSITALAEWELNGGRIHPFYDGCGRISRLFSSRILLSHDMAIPLWENREKYFSIGETSKGSFEHYMWLRMKAGRAWLDKRKEEIAH